MNEQIDWKEEVVFSSKYCPMYKYLPKSKSGYYIAKRLYKLLNIQLKCISLTI